MKGFIHPYFVMIVVWEFIVYLTIVSKLDRGLWKVQSQRKVCFLNSPHHTLKMSFLFRLCIIYICTCSGRNFKETIPLSIITGSCDTNPNPYFPYHVMVLVLFSLSCDTIRINFLLSSSQFTRTFARAEDEVSKKLFPWVSSRDLHWENNTYRYPPIKNSNVISKDRYTPIRGSDDAMCIDPQPFGTKDGGTAVELLRFPYHKFPAIIWKCFVIFKRAMTCLRVNTSPK